MMRAYKSNRAAQAETPDCDRLLQLLCLIGQTLNRIELQLGKLVPINERPNECSKIITFSGGRR
jgi:hypothetical protein